MNTTELVNYLVTPVVQVALIMAVAEVIKKLGVKSRWIPLVDLGLGIVSGVVVFGISQGIDMVSAVLLGIALGLSACGAFSGIKNLTEK